MSEFNPQQLAQYDTLPSMAQGYSLARGISNDIRTRNETDQSKAAVESLINDPSPKNILAVTLRYPQKGEGIRNAFENMDIEERKRRVATAIPVYSASLSGRGDIAKKLLLQQAQAMEASGGDPDEIARLKEKADQAVNDPATFQREIGTALAYGMGEKYFASTFAAIEGARNDEKLLPYKQYESMAKAEKDTASTELDLARAPYAADMAAAQLESEKLKPWDTRADNATNAAQVKAALELNRINQDTLTQNLTDKRVLAEEKQLKEKEAYGNYRATVENTNNTINDLLTHPGLKTEPKLRVQAEQHPELSAGTDSFDFAQKLLTLKGQNFLQGVQSMKGSGAGTLSDTESKYVASTIDSLHVGMSNKALEAAFKNIKSILDKAELRANLIAKEKEKKGIMPKSTPDTVIISPEKRDNFQRFLQGRQDPKLENYKP